MNLRPLLWTTLAILTAAGLPSLGACALPPAPSEQCVASMDAGTDMSDVLIENCEECVVSVEVGSAMPEALIEECDENPESIADYIAAHEITYLTFAAGWCTACEKEVPLLNDLLEEFAGQSVGITQILIEGVYLDGGPPPQPLCGQWKALTGAEFDLYIDVEQNMLCDHFGEAVGTLPVHLLISGDGVVRLRLVGALPEDISARIAGWL
jgi:thiol-disulfide isomerase/thioredoxin